MPILTGAVRDKFPCLGHLFIGQGLLEIAQELSTSGLYKSEIFRINKFSSWTWPVHDNSNANYTN